MQRIYLDANGSCPSLKAAQDKLVHVVGLSGNPSSSHENGRKLRIIVDEARSLVAQAVEAHEKEVIFTSGASEANRLFVDAIIEKARIVQRKPRVLMSVFEHPSLLKPILRAKTLGQIELTFIELASGGHLAMSKNAIEEADVIVVCGAHNETGIIPKIPFDDIRSNTIVMSDISQSFSRLGKPHPRIDVMTFSAQKMGGIAGVGGIVMRGQARDLPSPWVGGSQERGLRPGTECTSLIAAFGEACRFVDDERRMHQDMASLRDYLEDRLIDCVSADIIGKDLPRLANTSAICFRNEDKDALRIACDLAGLSVGFGSACSGLAPEGSLALKSLGLDAINERKTIRFSLYRDTTRDDVDEAIERLMKMVLTASSKS